MRSAVPSNPSDCVEPFNIAHAITAPAPSPSTTGLRQNVNGVPEIEKPDSVKTPGSQRRWMLTA